MGTDSRNGVELDLEAILADAAAGNFTIPSVIEPLNENTDPTLLFNDEGINEDNWDDDLIAVYMDQTDEVFPILSGSIYPAWDYDNITTTYVWNTTTSAYDLKYVHRTGSSPYTYTNYDSPVFVGTSLIKWFGVANVNYQKTADLVYTYSTTYTAQISFSEVGQQAALIIGFGDPNQDLKGAVAAVFTCSGSTASALTVGNVAIMVPDAIASIGLNPASPKYALRDALTTAATGGTYTVFGAADGSTAGSYWEAARLSAHPTTGWVKMFDADADGTDDTPMFVKYSATNTQVLDINTNYMVRLTVTGAATGATLVASVNNGGTWSDIVTFSAFSGVYDGTTSPYTPQELWAGSWQTFLSAQTQMNVAVLGLLRGTATTITKAPSASYLNMAAPQ
jgi:hypothetical protein